MLELPRRRFIGGGFATAAASLTACATTPDDTTPASRLQQDFNNSLGELLNGRALIVVNALDLSANLDDAAKDLQTQVWAAGATSRSLTALARSDADNYAVELAQRTAAARHAAGIAPVAPAAVRGVLRALNQPLTIPGRGESLPLAAALAGMTDAMQAAPYTHALPEASLIVVGGGWNSLRLDKAKIAENALTPYLGLLFPNASLSDDERVKGVAMMLLHEGAHGGNSRTPAINARALRVFSAPSPVAHLRATLRRIQMVEIGDEVRAARVHLRLFQDRDFLKKWADARMIAAVTGDQSHNSTFALDALLAGRWRPALTRDQSNLAQIAVSDYLRQAGVTEQPPNRDSMTGLASPGFTNPASIYQTLQPRPERRHDIQHHNPRSPAGATVRGALLPGL